MIVFSNKIHPYAIDILIGTDCLWDLTGMDIITSSCGLRAQGTKLGWVIWGSTIEPKPIGLPLVICVFCWPELSLLSFEAPPHDYLPYC